jgi:TrmH family RNA methyltransferase
VNATHSPDFITSAANPLVKRARKLRQRKHREQEGAFLVEGIQPVWQAVEHCANIETLLYAPELVTSDATRALIAAHERRHGRVVRLGAAAFGSFAERDHPSGVAAIVRSSTCSLDRLAADAASVFVALEEVGNPGNLGTIVRTVDAVGGAGVIVMGDATDPYHPTAVRASMGTIFTVPICRARGLDQVVEWCRDRAVHLVTTSAHARVEHWSVHYELPVLLLLGSEGRGLSEKALVRGELAVRIPMEGSASSLNLAVASGVLLYEIKRRGRESKGRQT